MIDLSACPISLDPSERQKLEELARQLPLIAELSACELFIDCVGDDGGVVVAHAWSNQLGSFYAAPAVGKHVSEERAGCFCSLADRTCPARPQGRHAGGPDGLAGCCSGLWKWAALHCPADPGKGYQ